MTDIYIKCNFHINDARGEITVVAINFSSLIFRFIIIIIIIIFVEIFLSEPFVDEKNCPPPTELEIATDYPTTKTIPKMRKKRKKRKKFSSTTEITPTRYAAKNSISKDMYYFFKFKI